MTEKSYIQALEETVVEYHTTLTNIKTISESIRKREQDLKDPRSEATLTLLAEVKNCDLEELRQYSDIFHKYFEMTGNQEDIVPKEEIIDIFKKELKKRPKMRIISTFCGSGKRIKLKVIQ